MTNAAKHDLEASRVSEEVWLAGAHRLLVERGVEAVKIMPLAKMLGVSRTSFYWYFADRDALLDALIARWRRKNTNNLIQQTRLYAETICEAVFNLCDCWLDDDLFDAQLDFAMRNWALNAPDLKETMDAADAVRIDAIGEMFTRFGYSASVADVRARTIYYTQTGYISMGVQETVAARLERMARYVDVFTGATPTDTEIARFRSRHAHREEAV